MFWFCESDLFDEARSLRPAIRGVEFCLFLVLNIDSQFLLWQAYQHLGEANIPKFTVIVAQKNHHTKLFQTNSPDNVPPGLLLSDFRYSFFYSLSSYLDLSLFLSSGTVVDTKIVHPRNYDFNICAQAGMIVSPSLSNLLWSNFQAPI